jgi:glycerol uptake facilitator-like aquaporin
LIAYNKVSPAINNGDAFLAEVLFTFFLVITVLMSVINSKMDAGFAPTMIGLSVLTIHLAGITVDGVSVNPARSFGPSVVANNWDNHWIFWFGPIVICS